MKQRHLREIRERLCLCGRRHPEDLGKALEGAPEASRMCIYADLTVGDKPDTVVSASHRAETPTNDREQQGARKRASQGYGDRQESDGRLVRDQRLILALSHSSPDFNHLIGSLQESEL